MNEYNNQYNQYNRNNEEQYYTTAPQPPKKKARTGLAVFLAVMVAAVGGASGFCGAYLAGSIKSAETESSHIQPGGSTFTPSESGTPVSSSVSNALSALNSGTAPAEAVNTANKKVVPTGPNGEYTAVELYEAVGDAIVVIDVYKTPVSGTNEIDYYNYFFGFGGEAPKENSEPVLAGAASGIVFTEDGYIITNAHVVDEGDIFKVTVNDYSEKDVTYTYEAELIGSDDDTDIAILKIERREPFLAAEIGDSDTLKVGQDVCAIGNPGFQGWTFEHTLTKGVISGLNRDFYTEGYSTSLIQTDAPINYGNSGGALFDMYGRVIGVVNKKVPYTAYDSLGFAITINEVKPIMEDLLSYGRIKSRPILGIQTIALNERVAQQYGTKLSKGMLVVSINEKAAIKDSGLKLNDIITKVDGTNVEKLTDVQRAIKDKKAGDKVTLTVAREKENGTPESVDVEVILSESSIYDD